MRGSYVEVWQLWQRVRLRRSKRRVQSVRRRDRHRHDKTNLVKVEPMTHLFGSSVETTSTRLRAIVWDQLRHRRHRHRRRQHRADDRQPELFEYGGRLGYRISQGWVADVFVNGTAGPQPVGNTIHGGWAADQLLNG